MTEANPYLEDPLPDAGTVHEIVNQALHAWVSSAQLPYQTQTAGGRLLELKQLDMFYIQQAVRLAISEHEARINAFLKDNMRSPQ